MAALPFMTLPWLMNGQLPTASASASLIPDGDATVLYHSPNFWEMPYSLGGAVCEAPKVCREVPHQPFLPLAVIEPGLAQNVETLNSAMENTPDDKIVYAFSAGSRVAGKWLEDYGTDNTAVPSQDTKFILTGSGGRKYGGVNGWFYGERGIVNLLTPTDTDYEVVDVALEYDPIADFPDNPFNLLALANAVVAFDAVHMRYDEADIDAPGNYAWTEVNTTYVYIPTETLPLLQGFYDLGLGWVVQDLEEPLRALIDTAYERDYLDDANILDQEATPAGSANTVQPTAAVTTTAVVGEACSGYKSEGCDINAPQSYTPVTPPNPDAASWQNVLPNLVNAVMSVPRATLDAFNGLSYALEETGSWNVYTPTNVLGYDPADPLLTTAVTNLLIPFPALANPLGEHLKWWALANLPMDEGCTGTAAQTCQDATILSKMFRVPMSDLMRGYVFPELNNPVSAEEGAAGEEIPGSEGDPVPWSGQAVQLNPMDPIYSVANYLFAPPEQNRPEQITLDEVVQSLVRFGEAMWLNFNPFPPGGFYWKGAGYTFPLLTPLLKPFVKILCPSCDTEHPEDPTPFDGQLPPSSEGGGEETSGTTRMASTTTVGGDAGDTTATEKADAPAEDEPASEEAAPVADDVAEAPPVDEDTTQPEVDIPTETESEDSVGTHQGALDEDLEDADSNEDVIDVDLEDADSNEDAGSEDSAGSSASDIARDSGSSGSGTDSGTSGSGSESSDAGSSGSDSGGGSDDD